MAIQYEIKLPHDHDEHVFIMRYRDTFTMLAVVVFRLLNKMEKFDDFIKHIDDFESYVIDARVLKERVNKLFEDHKMLFRRFNNYMTKYHNITLPFDDGQQCHEHAGENMKVANNCELPWDVLDIISRKLDFKDLIQFGGVCKNWWEFRKTYWRDFLPSGEPLLVRKSYDIKKSYSFISIAHQKIYQSKKMNDLKNFSFFGFSSGYLITGKNHYSFVLMNPFTRRVIQINTSTFKLELYDFAYYVLLAFGKDSEDFVFITLCRSSHNLHVYQSRNFNWVTYSTMENPWKLVDFAVLHNIIYVITDNTNIGVLSLNSANIKFFELKSAPEITSSSYLRMTDCDGQLLVFNNVSNRILITYKIDFSTMSYVLLETLGDVAIFYAPIKKYYALSNPGKWGYRRNSAYIIDYASKKCILQVQDDSDELPKFIRPRNTEASSSSCLLDWCFRDQYYEVDYSLVE